MGAINGAANGVLRGCITDPREQPVNRDPTQDRDLAQCRHLRVARIRLKAGPMGRRRETGSCTETPRRLPGRDPEKANSILECHHEHYDIHEHHDSQIRFRCTMTFSVVTLPVMSESTISDRVQEILDRTGWSGRELERLAAKLCSLAGSREPSVMAAALDVPVIEVRKAAIDWDALLQPDGQIYVRATLGARRKRRAILHELAHLIMRWFCPLHSHADVWLLTAILDDPGELLLRLLRAANDDVVTPAQAIAILAAKSD